MRIALNYVWGMRQSSAYDEEGGEFSPPTGTNERLTCDLLIAGGGLSGLSAAEAALRRGLDVVVIEKGAFGYDAASPSIRRSCTRSAGCGHSCAARSRDASGLPSSTITTTCAHPCSMAR